MTTTRPAQEIGTDGITTIWVPFTTPGPPLLACSSSFYYLPGQPAPKAVAFDPFYGQEVDTLVKCLPAEQTLWWFQHVKPESSKVNINFGPFSCPNGYTTATTSAINPITTLVACCPSLYRYAGTIMPPASIGQCNSTLTAKQTIVLKDKSGNVWTDLTTTPPASGSEIQGIHMNGYIFRDEVTSSTFPASTFASVTSTSPTLTATAASTSPPTTVYATMSSAPNVEIGGLSPGGRIGVGVGVSLGVVGLISLLVAFILFRRRNQHPNVQSVAEDPPDCNTLQPHKSSPEMAPETQNERSEMWVPSHNESKPVYTRAELPVPG